MRERSGNDGIIFPKALAFLDYHAINVNAEFHDPGRIAIDEAVLSRDGELEEREREQIKDHRVELPDPESGRPWGSWIRTAGPSLMDWRSRRSRRWISRIEDIGPVEKMG